MMVIQGGVHRYLLRHSRGAFIKDKTTWGPPHHIFSSPSRRGSYCTLQGAQIRLPMDVLPNLRGAVHTNVTCLPSP